MVMKRLFGAKAPEAPPVDPDKALEQLKIQADEREREAEDKKMMGRSLWKNKDMDKARLVMSQYEKLKGEAQSLRRNIAILEQQQSTFRGIEAKKTVVDVMKIQNARMKTAVQGLDVGNVDTVTEELNELLEDVHDVSAVLDQQFDDILPDAGGVSDDALFAMFEDEDANQVASQLDRVRVPVAQPAAAPKVISSPIPIKAAPVASFQEDWM